MIRTRNHFQDQEMYKKEEQVGAQERDGQTTLSNRSAKVLLRPDQVDQEAIRPWQDMGQEGRENC